MHHNSPAYLTGQRLAAEHGDVSHPFQQDLHLGAAGSEIRRGPEDYAVGLQHHAHVLVHPVVLVDAPAVSSYLTTVAVVAGIHHALINVHVLGLNALFLQLIKDNIEGTPCVSQKTGATVEGHDFHATPLQDTVINTTVLIIIFTIVKKWLYPYMR